MRQTITLHTWQIVCALILFSMAQAFIIDEHLLSDELLQSILEQSIEPERTDVLIEDFRSFSRWSILLSPALLCLRLLFLTFWIQTPFLLQDLHLTFKKSLRIVAYAQFSHAAKSTFQIVHLINNGTIGSAPLSMTAVLSGLAISHPLYSLASYINGFEVAWIIIISEGLFSMGRLKRQVIYPIVFLLWAALVLFQWTMGTVLIQWLS